MTMTNFDKTMSAAAFAEAGEHKTAKEMLGAETKQPHPAGQKAKSKPYLSTLLYGAISLTAYVFLFKNEQLITTTFTKGGVYTWYPVGTAFFFSFIHGAFASNLLNVLGLEAKK